MKRYLTVSQLRDSEDGERRIYLKDIEVYDEGFLRGA